MAHQLISVHVDSSIKIYRWALSYLSMKILIECAIVGLRQKYKIRKRIGEEIEAKLSKYEIHYVQIYSPQKHTNN